MQAMAGQGEQKVAAPGFQPLLLGVLGQKAKHLPADARVTGVPGGNDASHGGRHPPITPLHYAGRARGKGRWGRA